jgi:DNA mismatch repair protein MutS
MTGEVHLTPMLEQFMEVKRRHKDKIILFRMGDFYETFFDDAVEVSKVLGITLTARNHSKSGPVPLAGIPYHALGSYSDKITRAGLSYVVVEQTEDPKKAKGLVKRDVVEVVTPGTTLSETLLDSRRNNYLVAVAIGGKMAGLAEADLSTGEFRVTEVDAADLFSELRATAPAEVLASRAFVNEHRSEIQKSVPGVAVTPIDDWVFGMATARERIVEHFEVTSLKGFGAEHLTAGIAAAGGALAYLQDNQATHLNHIRRLTVVNRADYVVLDDTTQRNLELFAPLTPSNRNGTVISVIDETRTPMGGRLLRRWLLRPLKNLARIEARHEAIQVLVNEPVARGKIRECLSDVRDIERLTAKICCGRATPRDVLALAMSLDAASPLPERVADLDSPFLDESSALMANLDDTVRLILTTLSDEPPATMTDGGIIRAGVSPQLDELLGIGSGGKEWITSLQVSERERTGIPSLKVGFNRAFGYYIEISNSHRDKAPDDYIRKQTLVNAERYITPDLKEWEAKVLGAEEQSNDLERELFIELRDAVAGRAEQLLDMAAGVARIDVITGLAELAQREGYCRPEMTIDEDLAVTEGRHPVIERILGEASFIPNDLEMDNSENQVLVITGPNMAGKSTYLRQMGLLVILAHMGSWVPAKKAVVGLVDRVFTRVGAQDNLAGGESTFLVEMHETASILNNATPRSFILFDEVGRGTSTFDGLSLAWAIVEYLHNTPHRAAKTLFATHYHELVDLESLLPRVKNFNVSVREWNDEVIFLRKIVRGGCDHSYGIHVARMAGLPAQVLTRAREVLRTLEEKDITVHSDLDRESDATPEEGLPLFIAPVNDHPILTELRDVDLMNATPLEIMGLVDRWQKHLHDED